MEWISVKKELPDPRIRVRIRLVVNGPQGCIDNGWESTGCITPRGAWSMNRVDRMRITDTPTHWAHLPQ